MRATGGSLGNGVINWPTLALRHETWKTGWIFASSGRSSLYAIVLIFSRTWKGPWNLGPSFPIF